MKLINIIDRIEQGNIVKSFFDKNERTTFTYDEQDEDYYDELGSSLSNDYAILNMLDDEVIINEKKIEEIDLQHYWTIDPPKDQEYADFMIDLLPEITSEIEDKLNEIIDKINNR